MFAHRLSDGISFAVLPIAFIVAIHVAAGAQRPAPAPLVEFEMMTWPEVRDALAAGRTTALIYAGGTEQRGPQNVNGGHTLMGRETVKAIALRLGNAIAMPVLPYSPNRASAELPGTLGLSNDVFERLLTEIAEQSIVTGFRTVILMGDHGGGQPAVYERVARSLDAKYAPQGIRVYYCDEVYAKANSEIGRTLESKGYPPSSHAGVLDTSEMLFLAGDRPWVRTQLIPTALGDPVSPRDSRADSTRAPRLNNGITGDARRSTADVGRLVFDTKVDYAVRQINRLVGGASAPQN